ncbi:zinc ribbon domain-containing protein [Mycolicibacterium senegalense]|uniref:FmdB family zinc ribbon protein n=1 Tax=Mycolicibacterium TaxID=1866885 RepID=UPI0002DEC5E1|nr:zinc ribbon domain-containing protein [Mycolicibacterium conceptionense]
MLYVFRCASGCSSIERGYSMNARPDAIDCPSCGAPARRMISSPNLSRADTSAMALQDATRATADRPAVTSGPPPGGRRQIVTANPLHQKLPRP